MKDNFSTQACAYSKFRPTYPDEVFRYLYSHVHNFGMAWDCGTGNGQVAVRLAEKFESVIATDISKRQIDHAGRRQNIIYRQESAEEAKFSDNQFDLITVAQAVHWFDFNRFYSMVNRVLKPDGLIAVLGYGLLKVNDSVDEVIDHLYESILRNYWDTERKYIDEEYRTIPFPFRELPAPSFSRTCPWTIDQMTGFLNTWSAVQHFRKLNRKNPVELIVDKLSSAWGSKKIKEVRFPILMKLGKRI